MKFSNYTKIGPDGVVPVNTPIDNMDIIMGKVLPIKDAKNDLTKTIKFEDSSKYFRTDEPCYMDKNHIGINGEGYTSWKCRIRADRIPEIGDKFSSRHGQKGTVGNIIPECDMPFTSNGLKPDIIINPHAIPSRMTIGQLKETVLGKVLIELGLFGDGTSFGDFDVKDICQELINLGYEAHGNELLHNGLTGEQHECSVFMGPVFYQRLKHMVNDKAHSRAIGPMVNLTRQPAEGRSRDGGLRFGEMEKDAMVSHGAARFTRGRMYDASDKYSAHICKKCGLIAAYNNEIHIHHCRTCDNRVDFAYVEIPSACKLLFQELNTMNIVPRIMTER
jgi:DNA-directed RNA polymerase II subunit RPB2